MEQLESDQGIKTDIPAALIFVASKILMIQNIAIIGLYLVFRVIGGSIDPPWFTIPSDSMSIVFFIDLLGFILLIFAFLLKGIKEKDKSYYWLAGGITGWLLPRLYWQFFVLQPILPPFAYGRIRFIFVIAYQYALNVNTVYLFFISAIIPFILINKVKDGNKISIDLYTYFKYHFYAGTILAFPHLIITDFLVKIQLVMALSIVIVMLLKFYMILYGFNIFRNFYSNYQLSVKD